MAENCVTFLTLLHLLSVKTLIRINMKQLDLWIFSCLCKVKGHPLLYRFTLGTRILLAIGFIPTGGVKLLRLPFSTMGPESQAGALFGILHQSGLYWQFLGFAQVLAGVLILFRRTSALGAIMFFAIISNIFFITVSYEFSYTPIVSGLMWLATWWLLFWEWDRIRGLVYFPLSGKYSSSFQGLEILKEGELSGALERGVYTTGFLSGLLMFSVLRGIKVSEIFVLVLLLTALLAFLAAVVLGIRHRSSRYSPRGGSSGAS